MHSFLRATFENEVFNKHQTSKQITQVVEVKSQ